MKRLTAEEFRTRKRSDTLVIYGSGFSIRQLTPEDRENLARFDSISFNWFCKSNIPTTFYTIREQATLPIRIRPGEEVEDLLETLNGPAYRDTCLIVLDMTGHTPEAFPWAADANLDRLHGEGVVLTDLRKGKPSDFRDDIFEVGVHHGKNSMTTQLHLAVYLGYRSIVFVGVDLYDCRYFWLGEDEDRVSRDSRNLTRHSRHPTTDATLKAIKATRRRYRIEMYSFNPKSLLTEVLPAGLPNREPITR
ncbi:MAG TPA: hypothetical protein VD788_14240 [Candidatus Polarisedimenticolaceae bacterium]|nr:hypothetical protein [Candidatus Polarisedimenticolaceae bacterium]